MSYNLSAFNRTPFNLSESGNATYFTVEGKEIVDAYIGVSSEVYLFCVPHEHVGINIHGEGCKHFIANGHEYIGWQLGIDRTSWRNVHGIETIYTDSVISSENTIKASGEEKLINELSIACHRAFDINFNELINTDILWHIDYHTSVAGNELISQNTSGEVNEEIVCMVLLTLMPSQRLVIDASNYNVLLNGISVIHTQQGEWLDEISRETRSITITAGEGGAGLKADILYTERYL